MRRIIGSKRHKRRETKKRERQGADDKGWMTVQTHADEVNERF